MHVLPACDASSGIKLRSCDWRFAEKFSEYKSWMEDSEPILSDPSETSTLLHMQPMCNPCATHVQPMCSPCGPHVQPMCNPCKRERGLERVRLGDQAPGMMSYACMSMAQEGSCFETASSFHLILGCSKQSAEPTKQHQTKAFRIPPILHSTFHSDAAEEPQVSDPLQRC